MKKWIVILFTLLLAALLAGGIYTAVQRHRAEEKQRALEEAAAAFAPPAATQASTEAGQLLADAWLAVCRAETEGELSVEGDEAEQRFLLTTLDTQALRAAVSEGLTARLPDWVAAAQHRSEVYNEDGSVREELPRQDFPAVLREALSTAPVTTREATLRLRYADGLWVPENEAELHALLLGELADPDALAETLLAEAGPFAYIPLHYTLPEDALSGPVPDPDGFGETDDPAVIEALLQRPEAQRLIGGQETVWRADIEFFPRSLIRWYLDESILVLVWQEEEAQAVGTFSEVFIADGSQFRRKVSGDQMFDAHYEKVSEMGKRANAVLAIGGDMYFHARECGVVVYQREIYRFEPDSCDTCYIDSRGDLLFTYRGQLKSEAEARQFIEDHDVLFSVAFGPVLIDEGEDVMPDRYPWGEIGDRYARSVLGQMGERHYLTMNINHGSGRWYHLVTLRAAADAMLRRGCLRAYTLDGGQTATTVLNGKLINRVQFNRERRVSDILYFATAIPEDDRP